MFFFGCVCENGDEKLVNRSFPVAAKMTSRRKIKVKSEKMEPVQMCGVLMLLFDSARAAQEHRLCCGRTWQAFSVWKPSNTAAHNDEITSGTQQKHHPKTEHSQDHHRRLHFPPSHYLFFFFRSHSQLQTEQMAARGSTSVFSLLRYIRFHFLSLSTFTALLSQLSAKCSNTCKPYKINSRYSRNRNDGCYACLFPQSCKCISHHHKFRVNQNIKMFFFRLEKEGSRLRCLQTQRAKLHSQPELLGMSTLAASTSTEQSKRPCLLLCACRGWCCSSVADLQNLLWVGVGSNWG